MIEIKRKKLTENIKRNGVLKEMLLGCQELEAHDNPLFMTHPVSPKRK